MAAGSLVDRGDEQVAQVADRVVLDVVHVAQAAQRGGVERPLAEGVEVDARQVEPGCGRRVALEVEPHARVRRRPAGG